MTTKYQEAKKYKKAKIHIDIILNTSYNKLDWSIVKNKILIKGDFENGIWF